MICELQKLTALSDLTHLSKDDYTKSKLVAALLSLNSACETNDCFDHFYDGLYPYNIPTNILFEYLFPFEET